MVKRTNTNPARRKILAQGLRGTVLCALASLAGLNLAKKNRLAREGKCINRGICTRCGIFDRCGLPQALSTKQVLSQRNNEPIRRKS